MAYKIVKANGNISRVEADGGMLVGLITFLDDAGTYRVEMLSKYKDKFDTHGEAVAFVRGVEAVVGYFK